MRFYIWINHVLIAIHVRFEIVQRALTEGISHGLSLESPPAPVKASWVSLPDACAEAIACYVSIH